MELFKTLRDRFASKQRQRAETYVELVANLTDGKPAPNAEEVTALLEATGHTVDQLESDVALLQHRKLLRAKLDERPYKVRIVADDPRSMAASLVKLEAVDSVTVDPDGALVVLSRNVSALQTSVPRLAQEQGIRLLRVEPLDESLESVFGYLVEG